MSQFRGKDKISFLQSNDFYKKMYSQYVFLSPNRYTDGQCSLCFQIVFYITKSQVYESEDIAKSMFSAFFGIPSGMPRSVAIVMSLLCILSRMHPYRMPLKRNHRPTERCIPAGIQGRKVTHRFSFSNRKWGTLIK